jgi:hypothetical protein
VRRHQKALVACGLYLVRLLAAQSCLYEALDSSGVPTHDTKRRGAGWLPGLADIGWSNRLGWYEDFHLVLAVNPVGVITGFSFGSASAKDQPLADTFFALRAYPHPAVPSVGALARGPYVVVDKGFEGVTWHALWQQHYGATVLCRPNGIASGLEAAAPVASRCWPGGEDSLREALSYLPPRPGTPSRPQWLSGPLGGQGHAA